MRKITLFLLIYVTATLCACAPKVATKDLHAQLDTSSTDQLLATMQSDENFKTEMWHNLNIARLLQNRGQYKESITYFNSAEAILNEYEERAKISMRNVGSGAGSMLFSKGSERYYGKGYERSLMHTLNGLNYLMLGDIDGAAIEMKKMEKRQEFWLSESEQKIKAAVDAQEKQKNKAVADVKVPPNYSMRAMLDDPEVAEMINNYQDSFSYTLSAIISAMAEDPEYSTVSCRRACALNKGAEALLASIKTTKGIMETVAPPPPPPPAPEQTAKDKKSKTKKAEAKPAPVAPQQPPAPQEVDVVVVALTGRAPALQIEKLPLPIGNLNYTTLDMPALAPASGDTNSVQLTMAEKAIPAPKLLRSDKMAYKTLKDEMPAELAMAAVRAVSKGAAAYAANEAGGELAGLITSITLHISSSALEQGYRNWELLPNSGYIATFTAPRGTEFTCNLYDKSYQLVVNEETDKGMFVFVSALSANNIRISHVNY